MGVANHSGGCLEDVSLFSPAKLNLGLKIVGRRPDGYHDLESLFWPIDFGDNLLLQRAETSEVQMRWAEEAPFPSQILPRTSENLISRVLKDFPFRDPLQSQWRVRVEKRIPIGGGLGGGSSNAGTLLRYFGQFDPLANLDNLATRLGADVPFFLDPRPTWVTGIGDKRLPIEVPANTLEKLRFILLMLPRSTSTPEIFGSLSQADFSGSGASAPALSSPEELVAFLSTCRNDLERAAIDSYPQIRTVLEMLQRTSPIYAGLSGTGSTCFGIYADEASREKSFQELQFFCRRINCKSVKASTFSKTLTL